MTNAQKWLNREYPKETRKEVTVLNINNRDLEGFLDLSDFSNLIRLDCSNNNLTKLNITSCQQLKKIDCENNHLIDFDYYSLNPNTLVELNIGNNSFTDQDCSVFSKFTNLKWLSINNNKFHGSLRALKKLSKLRKLDVRNTDLDIEVETLPNGLGIISYDNELESNDKEWKNTGQWIVAQWDFVKGGIYIYKCWKRLGFTTFAEIKPWLEAGLKVDEYQETYEWKVRKFTPEQAQEWIKTGVKSSDYEFVVWLRDIKNLDSNWITNYKEDYQILIERFKKYGLCSECNQPNTGDQWCQSCNAFRLKENFSNWTSGKTEIDQFIQNFQLEATGADKFLEWVPYEKFTNIKYLDKGGFGKVYKAKWIGGNIHHWDPKNKQWQREKENYHHCKGWWSREKDHEERFEYKWNWIEKIESCRIVALKSLNNSQNNLDFLSETEKHKIIDDWFNNIVPCYGLSQDPNTENYLMIMQYMPEGNLRHYLSNKNRELTLKDKLSQLTNIAQGLKDIHQKNLVHRDFHSGNILKGIEKTSCLITDLGLCKPVDEVSQEKKNFWSNAVCSSRGAKAATLYSSCWYLLFWNYCLRSSIWITPLLW